LINCKDELVTHKEFFDFLKSRVGMLDAVVISGGEPTLQKGLEKFIVRIKKLGFLVKLDTNGTSPRIVQDLLDKNLLDFIAMDIKAPLDKYRMIIGGNVGVAPKSDPLIQNVITSIKQIKESGVDHEFRTTYSGTLSKEDILEIVKLITVGVAPESDPPKFALQKYNQQKPEHSEPHTYEYFMETADAVKALIGDKFILRY